MKGTTMPSRVRMEKEALDSLTAEVKETIAAGSGHATKNHHSLKVIDVWNIQKNYRAASLLLRNRSGWM